MRGGPDRLSPLSWGAALAILLLSGMAFGKNYESVPLVRLMSFGITNDYDDVDVRFLATYGGPLHKPLTLFPKRFEEGWLAVALLPPDWTTHPLRDSGMFPPLTGFVQRGDSDWVFDTKPGDQIEIKGRFLVWNPPDLPSVGPSTAAYMPFVAVARVGSEEEVESARRQEAARSREASRTRQERADARAESKASVVEQVLVEMRRFRPDLGEAVLQERAEAVGSVTWQLDQSGISDARVRRGMIDSALEEQGLEMLASGEDY